MRMCILVCTFCTNIMSNHYNIIIGTSVTVSPPPPPPPHAVTTGFDRREVTISEERETEVCLVTEGVPALDTTLYVTLTPGTASEKGTTASGS